MESHLLQMRGLKLELTVLISYTARVASFTDAWIETPAALRRTLQSLVASFTDAWIETPENTKGLGTLSRIFYRCVD